MELFLWLGLLSACICVVVVLFNATVFTLNVVDFLLRILFSPLALIFALLAIIFLLPILTGITLLYR